MGAPKGNLYALGNTGGRPPIFKNAEDLENKIFDYFKYVNETEDEIITIVGLALFLGFCDKKSLYDYVKKKEFSYSVKRALSIVEKNYEKKLSHQTCTGAIFALKNMGWEDRQSIDQTTIDKTPPNIEFIDED